jgi:hypothetical protein
MTASTEKAKTGNPSDAALAAFFGRMAECMFIPFLSEPGEQIITPVANLYPWYKLDFFRDPTGVSTPMELS